MITTPLPSGGPVLVSMLNILEGFNFTEKDQGKSQTYHYILEVGTCEMCRQREDTERTREKDRQNKELQCTRLF